MSGNYKVPSMREINEIEKKFTVISTFSGGGGSCLGYKMAGGRVLVANEFIPQAQATYRQNFPDTNLLTGDIRTLKGSDFLESANLKVGELDIFDGSPPCSAFSTAGKRSKGWGKEKKYSSKVQVVDDLFFEYARLLQEIQPKVFIAENVKGLAVGNAKGYLKEIVGCLKMCGYDVKVKILNALNYGVPQNRERLIFIGVRKDLNISPVFPSTHVQWPPIGEAISGADNSMTFNLNPKTETYKIYMKCRNEARRAQFTKYAPKGGWYTHYRLSNNDHSCTISTCQDTYHPDEPRTLSIGELKRIQSLPDDFITTGKFAEQWERIGRMVAPYMMKHVAETMYERVLKNV